MSDVVKPSVKPPKIKKYKRPSGWKSALLLTFALVLLGAALLLRFMSGFDDESQLEQMAKVQQEKQQKNKKPNYLEIDTIDSVGIFARQVKPVTFDEVLLEQRNQDTEFQDAEYIAARKDAWTVQVMDVSKIEIIKDYLATKEKREQFAYFRYIADDKTKRYILTFDDFNGESGAQKAIDSIEFDLPASIKPFPRAFKDYVSMVEQYHLENKVRDYIRSNYREIHLRKTRAPVYHVNNNTFASRQTGNRASSSARFSDKKPTHKAYAQRAMEQNNAFQKQEPKTTRVIQPKAKTPSVAATDNTPSATASSPQPSAAKPATQQQKTAPSTQAANDDISQLIENIGQ